MQIYYYYYYYSIYMYIYIFSRVIYIFNVLCFMQGNTGAYQYALAFIFWQASVLVQPYHVLVCSCYLGLKYFTSAKKAYCDWYRVCQRADFSDRRPTSSAAANGRRVKSNPMQRHCMMIVDDLTIICG